MTGTYFIDLVMMKGKVDLCGILTHNIIMLDINTAMQFVRCANDIFSMVGTRLKTLEEVTRRLYH